MRLPPRIYIIWLFTCLTWLNEYTNARSDERRKEYEDLCPKGFRLAHTKTFEPRLSICYKLKGPEKFEDKFENCVGNLYSSYLYFGLDLPTTKEVLWAEYKSLHYGGPFMEWSYTNTVSISKNLPLRDQFGEDNKLCMVIDPVSNLTATRCDEKHFRYCFVDPYPPKSSRGRSVESCDSEFWRMYSPEAVCITEKNKVRVTWKQAVELCAKSNTSLLSRGWMYTNYVSTDKKKPVDIAREEKLKILEYDKLVDTANDSDLFYSVLCEKPVQLRNINLSLSVERNNLLILTANDSIEIAYIVCSDTSMNFVIISQSLKKNVFVLNTYNINGYYWCYHIDYNNYHVSKTNTVLYVEPKSVQDLYAVTIQWPENYTPTDLYDLLRETKTAIQIEYMWFEEALDNMSIQRVYFDERTVVVHVNLTHSQVPRIKGIKKNWCVQKIKRAYICDGDRGPNNITMLGESVQSGCSLFKCVGDFDEGVDWVETEVSGCNTPQHTSAVTAPYYVDENNTAVQQSTSSQLNEDFNDTVRQLPEILNPIPTPPRPPPNNATTSPETPPYNVTTTVPDVTTNSSGVEFVTTPNDVITVTNPPGVITVTTPPDESSDSSSEEVTTPNWIATTTMHPSEQLDLALNDLDTLLQNDTVLLQDVSNALDQVNSVLDFEGEDLEIPGRLLQMLDELGSRVELGGEATAKTVRGNIALLTADVSLDNPIRGMRVAARAVDTFDNDTFSFINDVNSSSLQTNDSEAVVFLPESILRAPRRVSFVTFRNEVAFRSNLSINSRIFSVNVENVTHFENGEVVDIHLSPLEPQPGRNVSRTCAYWQFPGDNSSDGRWDDAGCRLVAGGAGQLDTCRCTHLTHFAEVLVPRTVFSERNEAALEVISLIGCFLSMLGIVVIGLTAALFRSWRRDYSNKIWLQLSAAILVLVVCFIVAALVDFRDDLTCTLVGVALHYSLLASFCWMLVAGVLSYRRLVLVFTREVSHKLLRAAAFAWGLPCGVVGALLAARPRAYVRPFDELTPSAGFCYPTGLALWLAVYAPVCAILLVNWTLFALILRSVFASRRIPRHGDANEALRCASVSCLLVFLFGLPWIFGLFAFNVVAAYLFTFTGTFQGFVLFMFFVVGNKKTRDLWLNKLKIKQTRKVPVTSSTYTSRSTPGVAEAKVPKPRSLTSPDDSRFS